MINAFNLNIEDKDKIYNCVVFKDGYWGGFNKVVRVIKQELGCEFKQELEGFDSQFWFFDVSGVELTLHYHEMIGDVELFVDKSNHKSKDVLIEICDLILSKLNEIFD